jgi:putative peptide zinc metalloprotease protein
MIKYEIKGVNMNLTLHSRLLLVPVNIRKDRKHYIVEDIALGEFYEMPRVCIDAIHLINNGGSIEEIERVLKDKYPNDEVDMLDFAEQLLIMGLIGEVDGVKVELKEKKKKDLGLLWISPKIGEFFFNKAAYLVYFTLLLVNVFILLSHPSLFPHYKDLFVFDLMILNIPTWMGITIILVFIHEFGHILAMRAQNLPTKLEVGHRLILVVLETDMSSVWKLPSNKRNVLFLAGLCFDTLILSCALISHLIFTNGSEIFLGVMNVVVLDTFIRMVYQGFIYMKTDLYYVIENVSGCYNLMENAQKAIRKKLSFLNSPSIQEVVFEGEKKIVFLYSIFYFVGVILTVSIYTFFYVPQLLFAWKRILPGFSQGTSSLPFWDAILFTLQILIGLLLLLYSWRKKYTQR